MKFLLKLTAVLVTAMGTAGILVHDVHVDRMTVVALGTASAIATYGAVENILQKSEHIHVEAAVFSKKPNTIKSTFSKNRIRDDNRRYIQNKKVLYTGGGEQNGLWPSV